MKDVSANNENDNNKYGYNLKTFRHTNKYK